MTWTRAIDPGATSAIADAISGRLVRVWVFPCNATGEIARFIANGRPRLTAQGRGTIIGRGNKLILDAIAFGREVQKNFVGPASQAFDHVIGERPLLTQARPINSSPDVVSRGNDLISTAIRLGRLIELSQPRKVTLVFPGQWKGQVPKAIHNTRTKAKLTPAEKALVPEDHNAWDAVGLLLWALER